MARNTEPIESKDYPGFYISKPYPEVLISRSGEVLRLVTTKNQKNSICGKRYSKKGDTTFGSNANGYRSIYTWCGENHKYIGVKIHRIVGYAFHGSPPTDRPHINHKDGVKDNNWWENLEWCSPVENLLHSFIELDNKQVLRPVKIKDLLTGEVNCFSTLTEASVALDIHVVTLSDGLNKNEYGGVKSRYLVKHSDDQTPWPNVNISDIGCNTNIIAHHWESGEKIIFESIRSAVDYLGGNYTRDILGPYMTNGRLYIYMDYYFTRMISKAFWPTANEVREASTALRVKSLKRPVYWTNTKTGEMGRSTVEETALKLGCTAKNLSRCIRRENGKFREFHIKEIW